MDGGPPHAPLVVGVRQTRGEGGRICDADGNWYIDFSLGSGPLLAADEIHWTIIGQTAVTFDWRGTSAENTIRYGIAPGVYT